MPTILVVTFVLASGIETHWTERNESVAVCHARAVELASWAASQGVEIRYGCRPTKKAQR